MQANEVSQNHLLIFARVPKPGHNKTRLIPAIGPEKATEVYRFLAVKTLALADRLKQTLEGLKISVVFTGGSFDEARAAFGERFEYAEQCGDNLGDRLKFAVSRAFDAGAERVVVIGTDCPELNSVEIEAAFSELKHHDVILGPAIDGGYYLIGMARFQPRLFEEVEWSTSRVFEQTIARAQESSLKVQLLRCLSDVDHPEDLIPLRHDQGFGSLPLNTVAGRLSIIIPTLNEADNLQQTLNAIGRPNDRLEIIVVDGGSSDATVSIGQDHGCQTFVAKRGRARQLNAGAAAASGDQLMFLHADTRMPVGYGNEIARVLASGAMCGAFPLKIEGAGLGLRFVEVGVALRCKYFKLPYGDQAIFLRAANFFELGGFKPLGIMEDYEFIVRSRRLGQIKLASIPVRTSIRRWKSQGVLKTTVLNQICVLAYKLGFSDPVIARLYHGRKSSK